MFEGQLCCFTGSLFSLGSDKEKYLPDESFDQFVIPPGFHVSGTERGERTFENLSKSLKTFSLGPTTAAKRDEGSSLFFLPDPTVFSQHNWPFLLRPRRISGTRLFLKDYKDCLDIGGCVRNRRPRFRPRESLGNAVSPGGVGVNNLPAADCVPFPSERLCGENPFTHALTPAEMETDPFARRKRKDPPPRRGTL